MLLFFLIASCFAFAEATPREAKQRSLAEKRGSVTLPLTRGKAPAQEIPSVGNHGQKRQLKQRTDGKFAPSLYYGKLLVGTPAQYFDVAFDTGSGNIIIPSKRCTDEGCTGHRRYDPSLSNTSKGIAAGRQAEFSRVQVPRRARHHRHTTSTNGIEREGTAMNSSTRIQLLGERDDVEISFGQGLISGSYMSDRICLGGEHVCFESNFIAANFESRDPFSSVAFDGIVGLSLPELAEGAAFSVVERMMKASVMSTHVFSMFLGYEGEQSEATFGDYQRDRLASDLFWVPVTAQGFWQVDLDGARIGPDDLQVCTGRAKCQGVVDTGTTYIAAPSDFVTAIENGIELKEDCSNVKGLPDISFSIGGHDLSLKPEDYVLQSQDKCSLAFMPMDIPPPKGPLTILGEPLLRRYYTVYDRQHLRVGFALAKHAVQPPQIKAKPHRPMFPKLSKLIQSWGAGRRFPHTHRFRHTQRSHAALDNLKRLVR